jgi:hypothetical protein
MFRIILLALVAAFRSRRQLGIEQKVISYQSSWQKGFAERVIQNRNNGVVLSSPILGGVHHRCWRQAP